MIFNRRAGRPCAFESTPASVADLSLMILLFVAYLSLLSLLFPRCFPAVIPLFWSVVIRREMLRFQRFD
jgi:hypothetical protein